jgi:hypothetical protein
VWAEIWPDIGPRIETVMRTGVATWDVALQLFLERSGFAEETYHTFSYSPLTDEDGRIAGMLCVVSEDTERVIGERRLATLRDLGSVATTLTEEEVVATAARRLAGNAEDLPFVLTYLYDEDAVPVLHAAAGISPDHPVARETAWPREAGVVELDSPGLPSGAWDEPPFAAMVLPFPAQGQGQVKAQFEPVDLARYTAELASMFESAVERAALALEIDCPPLPEPVYVDREMWAKIVLNLLSNALKFTFEGGVTVRVRAQDGAARLTVADTGIGIPDSELPRLFERFHRVAGARSRSYEGSGIGLALVAELAELHGGHASATSRQGEGSEFAVVVPFGAEHLPAQDVRRETDAQRRGTRGCPRAGGRAARTRCSIPPIAR